MITPQDVPALTQQYEATTQSITGLRQSVAELDLRLEALEKEAEGLEMGSDRAESLIAEHDTALNQSCEAALRLRDAEEFAIALKELIKCLTPRKRTALETYLCKDTPENLAAAKGENLEFLARINAALAGSE